MSITKPTAADLLHGMSCIKDGAELFAPLFARLYPFPSSSSSATLELEYFALHVAVRLENIFLAGIMHVIYLFIPTPAGNLVIYSTA